LKTLDLKSAYSNVGNLKKNIIVNKIQIKSQTSKKELEGSPLMQKIDWSKSNLKDQGRVPVRVILNFNLNKIMIYN